MKQREFTLSDQLGAITGRDMLGNIPGVVSGSVLNIAGDDYGAIPDGVTDNSAIFQAANNDLYADGGGVIYVPSAVAPYLTNFVIYPNVCVVGDGWRSWLKSNPGVSTPIIGSIKQTGLTPAGSNWAPLDPSRNLISHLRLDGNTAGGATGRGIELVSSNDDAYWVASNKPQAPGDLWNDLAPFIEYCFIHDCSGDAGLMLGQNMRGAWVSKIFCFNNRQWAVINVATDTEMSDCQLGANGDGLWIQHAANKVVNTKAWYSWGNQTAPNGKVYTGSGVGFYVTAGTGGTLTGGTQFTGCETQDNYGYGTVLDDTIACFMIGHKMGGDSPGGIRLVNGTNHCIIRAQQTWADRAGSDASIVIDGSGSADPDKNDIEIFDDEAGRNPGWVPVKYINGGIPKQNAIRGFNQFAAAAPSASPGNGGSYTPDCLTPNDKRVIVPGSGNITINAPINDVFPSQRISFRFNNSGGGTVTWAAAWLGEIPAVDTAVGAQTVIEFVNFKSTVDGSSAWRCVTPSSEAQRYRPIGFPTAIGTFQAAQTAGNRYSLYPGGTALSGAANEGLCLQHLDPADVPTPVGRTRKLRVQVNSATNGNPNSNYTVELRPVTGASAVAANSGPGLVLDVPVATVVVPLRTATGRWIGSSEIDFPAAGDYAITVTPGATPPASTGTNIIVNLSTRYV